jgi:hypothetical protein
MSDRFNALRIQPPPEARTNMLAGPPQPDWAGATDENIRLYQDFLARDRQRQIEQGYVDPATGQLTPEGWQAQAQNIAGGFGPANVGMAGGFGGITRATTAGPGYSLQRLHPRLMTPITRSHDPTGYGEHVFSIRNPAGEDQGLIGTKWDPETGELFIRGIESNEGPNTLGLPAINQLRDALLELYPGVKKLTGHRISGMAPNRDAMQRVTQDQGNQ